MTPLARAGAVPAWCGSCAQTERHEPLSGSSLQRWAAAQPLAPLLCLVGGQALGDFWIELREPGPQVRETLQDLVRIGAPITPRWRGACGIADGACCTRFGLSRKIINGPADLGDALLGRRTHNRIVAASADTARGFAAHRDGRFPPF